jgi:hypothetical protein
LDRKVGPGRCIVAGPFRDFVEHGTTGIADFPSRPKNIAPGCPRNDDLHSIHLKLSALSRMEEPHEPILRNILPGAFDNQAMNAAAPYCRKGSSLPDDEDIVEYPATAVHRNPDALRLQPAPIEEFRVLNIPRAETGAFDEKTKTALNAEWKIFQAALAIYRARQELKG